MGLLQKVNKEKQKCYLLNNKYLTDDRITINKSENKI